MNTQKTVLIVEDEKNIVDILRFNLQREGYATCEAYDGEDGLAQALSRWPQREAFPLVTVCDDAAFGAASPDNWLWTAFTRSDPATDIYGANGHTHARHWSCEAPLVLDARLKPFHAPPLEEDPATIRRVEALAGPGGPLRGLLG